MSNVIACLQPPLTSGEAAIARAAGQLLANHVQADEPLRLRLADGGPAEQFELPVGAVRLLTAILEAMASGQGLNLIRQNAKLTTVQAADILNVSRPCLTKLLDEEKIPHRRVGRHRRIRMEDVMNYKNAFDAERNRALDQLVVDAQELGMGYTNI